MSRTIINLCGRCCPPRKKFKAAKHFTFRWATGVQSYVEGLMARITNEQQIPVTVEPKTAAGRPAAIDGDVVFASSDEADATVTSTGSKSAMVRAVAPGVAQISASFDADLDVGEVREVMLTGAIEVVAAEAETGEIVFGTPELTPLP
jgi:hypothetical protein